MKRERTQLNIIIDPKLLLKLKTEAIKNGKTLTDFVTEQLENAPTKDSEESQLEKRLLRIERLLMIDNQSHDEAKSIGAIFTDEGAKEYGQVAKAIFESQKKAKGLTANAALAEIGSILNNYPYSNPELIFQILLGTHDLTGKEMTIAYRHGSCAMRSALNDWTNDPLEELNKAFLDAVITKSLT